MTRKQNQSHPSEYRKERESSNIVYNQKPYSSSAKSAFKNEKSTKSTEWTELAVKYCREVEE